VTQSAGVGIDAIAPLTRFLILAAVSVCLIVAALVLIGGRRRRGSLAAHDGPHAGGGTSWIAFGGVLIPALVLAITFVFSQRTYAHVAQARAATLSAVTIEITGRQWWWQVRYRGEDGRAAFTTANEIHIPVGRPVRIELHSGDVNHSFWIPELNPKEDLIPGRVNTIVIQAARPGTYRGECSEFCGQEHARMAFTVVAETPERYAAWVARETAPPSGAGDTLAQRGREAFLSNACAFCHSVRGTMAQGVVAPDLTHFASRPTIAAGTLPNTPQNLEGWIMNAPALKPGTQMPAFPQLDATTLRSLVAFLEALR